MTEQTLQEWLKEGKEIFGEDLRRFAFICPCCKKISTVQDFIDLGCDGNDAYKHCIGRANGKGKSGFNETNKSNEHGCDWASYGLFGTLGNGRKIIDKDGKVTEIFDYATPNTK